MIEAKPTPNSVLSNIDEFWHRRMVNSAVNEAPSTEVLISSGTTVARYVAKFSGGRLCE